MDYVTCFSKERKMKRKYGLKDNKLVFPRLRFYKRISRDEYLEGLRKYGKFPVEEDEDEKGYYIHIKPEVRRY